MKNKVGLTLAYDFRHLDEDGQGTNSLAPLEGTFDPLAGGNIVEDIDPYILERLREPINEPVQEYPTQIIYPQIIEQIAPVVTLTPEYLPEENVQPAQQPETIIETPAPAAEVVTTTATANEPTTANKLTEWIKENKVLVLAGGAGLFLLLNKKKKKKVGKIDNKRLLIAGAAAAGIYLLMKRNSNAPTMETAIDPIAETYVPGTPSPSIEAPAEFMATLQTAAAIADREALLRYITDAAVIAAIKQMNDAEIIAMYNYIFGYVVLGKKLYQYPNDTGIYLDGGWDTNLYNQIQAIKSKYNLFNSNL